MAQSPDLSTLTASQAQDLILSNYLSIQDYVHSLLSRYRSRDEQVNAWACINPEQALSEARRLDGLDVSQRGPLHGFVMGVKDVFTTQDYPTAYNSPIHADDGPLLDASSVAILRRKGALMLGKTKTTEFAVTTVGPGTSNAHSPSRSPGGSSSGSAAAVADFQCPVALGTQTIGSIVRPASFNGIYGFKPTWNAVSTEGQKVSAPTFDTFGVFSRGVDDLVRIANVFSAFDYNEEEQEEGGERKSVDLKSARFAVVRTNQWDKAGPGTIAVLQSASAILRAAGAEVEDISLPSEFDNLPDMQSVIMRHEAHVSLYREYTTRREGVSEELAGAVNGTRGEGRLDKAGYLRAFDGIARLRPMMDGIAGRYTGVLAASAVDVAPVGREWTGDSVFNGIWTALHVPVVNIPGFKGEDDMPVGVSLIAGRYRDRHLLEVAKVVGELFSGVTM